MSHWDFAGAGQHDPYAEDTAGWPPGSFPAMFPGERDQGAEPGAGRDDGPADEDEDEDEGDDNLYPLTYERAADVPADVPADLPPPAPPSPDGAPWAEDGAAAAGRERGVGRGHAGGRGAAPPLFGSPSRPAVAPLAPDSPGSAYPPGEPAASPPAWMDWELGPDQRRHRHVGRPVLLVAGIALVAAAGAGAGAAVLTAGHPGHPAAAPAASGGTAVAPAASGATAAAPTPSSPAPAPSSPAPASSSPASASSSPASPSPAGASSPAGAAAASAAPLSLSQAQAVVAAYTTANNAANAARSDTGLAAIETGSSEALDASLFQQGQAAGTAPFPAFGPVRSTYYLPRDEPASGPRWFAVQVANAFTANPAKVTSTEYLLFTQASAGGPWRNALEPYLLSGASAPPVATGADGLATAVAPDAADAVAPGDLPAVTATALDTAAGSRPAVADPGNLADRADQRQWRTDVPGSTVTDAHAPASGADGQEFALLTTGGGALVFYTDAATVTVTPPAGTMLHVTVPGYFSPGQALSQATVDYLEQFAAYDPPSGQGGPGVVADYSAITGRD